MRLLMVPALLVGVVTMSSWTVTPRSRALQGTPPGVASDSRPTKIISPSVVATTMVRTLNGASSLNLMVLWRGSAGWYLKEGPRSEGGRTTDRSISARIQRGGVTLEVEFERQSRAVLVQGSPVTLQPANANVVLVDNVDGAGLKVVSTLHVDPAMPADKSIVPLLKQSMQIVSFLQCDQKVADPMAQFAAYQTCQAVIGK